MNASTNAVRRIATLDIETVSLDPNDPKGALDAMTGRIVCIGLLFDDGEKLKTQCVENRLPQFSTHYFCVENPSFSFLPSR